MFKIMIEIEKWNNIEKKYFMNIVQEKHKYPDSRFKQTVEIKNEALQHIFCYPTINKI
jgi:hypothetical protein